MTQATSVDEVDDITRDGLNDDSLERLLLPGIERDSILPRRWGSRAYTLFVI
jgi:hypothetical protein